MERDTIKTQVAANCGLERWAYGFAVASVVPFYVIPFWGVAAAFWFDGLMGYGMTYLGLFSLLISAPLAMLSIMLGANTTAGVPRRAYHGLALGSIWWVFLLAT